MDTKITDYKISKIKVLFWAQILKISELFNIDLGRAHTKKINPNQATINKNLDIYKAKYFYTKYTPKQIQLKKLSSNSLVKW